MPQRIRVLASWAALVAAAAAGPSGARADLAEASPFLAPGVSGAAASSGPSGPIELRGVMSTTQGDAYCIYDTAKKTSTWVGLNETGYDFVVKSADPSGENVTVDLRGQVMKLALHASKVASAGPAGAPVNVTVQQGLQNVALNPTPADEQRRLDAVAAEVRRRRAEREKAAQAAVANPGGAAPPAPSR